MSKPDIVNATEKQYNLSIIDDILKDMTNEVEEGKTLLNQPSATCELIILFSCTSVNAYSNLNLPSILVTKITTYLTNLQTLMKLSWI